MKKVKTIKVKKNEWLLFYTKGSDKCYFIHGLGNTIVPDKDSFIVLPPFTKKKDGADKMVELGLTQIKID